MKGPGKGGSVFTLLSAFCVGQESGDQPSSLLGQTQHQQEGGAPTHLWVLALTVGKAGKAAADPGAPLESCPSFVDSFIQGI